MEFPEMTSFQYTAHCRRCSATRSLVRAEVVSGRNPICATPGCGDAMVVYSGAGALPRMQEQGDPEARLRANEGG
jgi:hypothetical protein